MTKGLVTSSGSFSFTQTSLLVSLINRNTLRHGPDAVVHLYHHSSRWQGFLPGTWGVWAWEEEGWGRLDIGGADWVGAESRGSLCKAETQCTPPVCSPLHITCWESHSPAPTPELFFPVKVSCSVVFYSLRDSMACSPPGSSVHGILQARILERVAMPFFRGSSRPEDWTWVFHIAGRFLTIWATREAFFFPATFLTR